MRNVGSVLTRTRNACFGCMKCPNSDRNLAQLLLAQKENPYKVKAYRRAAAKVRTLSESIDELVAMMRTLPHTPALLGTTSVDALKEKLAVGTSRRRSAAGWPNTYIWA